MFQANGHRATCHVNGSKEKHLNLPKPKTYTMVTWTKYVRQFGWYTKPVQHVRTNIVYMFERLARYEAILLTTDIKTQGMKKWNETAVAAKDFDLRNFKVHSACFKPACIFFPAGCTSSLSGWRYRTVQTFGQSMWCRKWKLVLVGDWDIYIYIYNIYMYKIIWFDNTKKIYSN